MQEMNAQNHTLPRGYHIRRSTLWHWERAPYGGVYKYESPLEENKNEKEIGA